MLTLCGTVVSSERRAIREVAAPQPLRVYSMGRPGADKRATRHAANKSSSSRAVHPCYREVFLTDLLSEAQEIIAALDLFSLLSRYGKVRLVGSVALDLIVKLDIDLHLLVATHDLLSVVDGIYHPLLERPQVHEVRITDWRQEGGVKIGIDAYPSRSGDWSIDLWVTDRPEATAFALVDDLKSRLRREHREVILALKHHYHQGGLLRQGLSLLIYRAVLDGGVRSVDEFEVWRGKADPRMFQV